MKKLAILGIVIMALCALPVMADVYSLSEGSETLDLQGNDYSSCDIMTAGPGIHVWCEELGLDDDQVGPDELNALSAGLDIVNQNDVIFFSVGTLSVGLPGTGVQFQSQLQPPEQAADIFVTTNPSGIMAVPIGNNNQVYDEQGQPAPGAPGFGLLGGNLDNIDAYSQDEFDFQNPPQGVYGHDVPVYFSLATGSASLVPNNATANDILISLPDAVQDSGSYTVYKNGLNDIGLLAGDDIDALALEIVDSTPYGGSKTEEAYFSLAPNSPTLIAGNYSAADIFYTNFNGSFTLAYTAAMLGLEFDDNVDAMETNAAPIPEPATMMLLSLGGAALLARRRRKK